MMRHPFLSGLFYADDGQLSMAIFDLFVVAQFREASSGLFLLDPSEGFKPSEG